MHVLKKKNVHEMFGKGPVKLIGDISPDNFSDVDLNRIACSISRKEVGDINNISYSDNINKNLEHARVVFKDDVWKYYNMLWYFCLPFTKETTTFLLENDIELPFRFVEPGEVFIGEQDIFFDVTYYCHVCQCSFKTKSTPIRDEHDWMNE